VCCSALQCVAVYSKQVLSWCSVSIVKCSVLQCVAVCCSVLQCVAVCCSALQCAAVRCNLFHTSSGMIVFRLTWIFMCDSPVSHDLFCVWRVCDSSTRAPWLMYVILLWLMWVACVFIRVTWLFYICDVTQSYDALANTHVQSHRTRQHTHTHTHTHACARARTHTHANTHHHDARLASKSGLNWYLLPHSHTTNTIIRIWRYAPTNTKHTHTLTHASLITKTRLYTRHRYLLQK